MADCERERERKKMSRTTFFLSSDEEGLRSFCSEGDLGGRRPGEPNEDGGLVESFGDGSGPNLISSLKKQKTNKKHHCQCRNTITATEGDI